ncbi:MAG: phosphotransferase [Congregibacter sp.]|nr:phosphotransferase [Congregibacter sp.]
MATADVINPSLERWEEWQLATPLEVRPGLGVLLAKGSGHSIFEILGTPQLVGRLRHQSTRLTEEAFRQEHAAWSRAAHHGLAPRIVFTDEQEQVVICERVEAAGQPVSAEALGRLCRQIHEVPGVSHRLVLSRDIEHYLDQLPADLAHQWRAAMQACDAENALARLAADTPYLCHNDLTPGNLMTHGDDLIAIDWEYAAMGSRYFDAGIACASLPDGEQDTMMRHVFGDTLDEGLVTAGKHVAGLVTALWQCCFAVDGAPSPAEWLRSAES